MNIENWKKIPNTNHEISDFGNVRNEFGNSLKTWCNEFGYPVIAITLQGKSANFKIHRLVAKAFVENPYNFQTVNHKDCVKLNNHFTNLEWMSSGDNTRHAFANGLNDIGEDRTQAKLTDSDVLAIKEAFAEGASNAELAKVFGVARGAISKIRSGDTWKHISGPVFVKKSIGFVSKLTIDDIPKIRNRISEGFKDSEIGRLFGVHAGTIHQIRIGKNWKNY